MTLIASAASLLHAAVQDLHAGHADAAGRLPDIATLATDAALGAIFRDEGPRAAEQAERLVVAGLAPAGPPNLWMAGILDDAERDGRSTQSGRLLDIALIGAIRKGMAAMIVAAETALALAGEVQDTRFAVAVTRNMEEAVVTDRALKARLAALAG